MTNIPQGSNTSPKGLAHSRHFDNIEWVELDSTTFSQSMGWDGRWPTRQFRRGRVMNLTWNHSKKMTPVLSQSSWWRKEESLRLRLVCLELLSDALPLLLPGGKKSAWAPMVCHQVNPTSEGSRSQSSQHCLCFRWQQILIFFWSYGINLSIEIYFKFIKYIDLKKNIEQISRFYCLLIFYAVCGYIKIVWMILKFGVFGNG